MSYDVLMLLVLILFVSVIIFACIGFGTVVRWVLRRRRSASPPGACSGAMIDVPPPAVTESSLAEMPEANAARLDGPSDGFAFEPERTETSDEPPAAVSPSLEDAVNVPQSDSKCSLEGSLNASPLFRCGVVIGIGLLLLIPLMLVESLVQERAGLYRDVVRDISRTWGGQQRLSGPYLLIPYTQRVIQERVVPTEKGDGKIVRESRLESSSFVVLPSQLSFKAVLDPESRQRGIYRALVYSSEVDISGRFTLPSREAMTRIVPGLVEVDFNRAFVVMGLSHPSALRKVEPFVWGGTPYAAEPGTQPFEQVSSGFRIPIRLDGRQTTFDFSQRLSMSGSDGIRFAPAGETTDISVRSPWPHPSFQGQVLPASYETSDKGFSATWSVPSLARSYPNLGLLHSWPDDFTSFAVGVDLYQPGTHYGLVERSVKYGVLFIGLTFLAFIVFEMGLGARLHPIQYGIVGLSMVVFYLVLLSLSEHLAFLTAYLSASACIILMVSAYVGAALRSVKEGLGIGVLLLALYTLLYTILQMEDYALLMGTALILVMLAALMVVSRNLARWRT